MVSEVFAEDGVQLALNGKIIKGRQQIMEYRRIKSSWSRRDNPVP
jgi:hypothetical protein